MIKLRGFGGKPQAWEYNLESFTRMAGWRRDQEDQDFRHRRDLDYATGVERMAATIDTIARGRFCIVRSMVRPDFLVEIVSIPPIGKR